MTRLAERFNLTKARLLHYYRVTAGFVYEPEHYVYSSAINYIGQQCLIDVLLME